jgi:peptidoglycan/LPS O-acetylase OafA/YrhL
MFFYLLFSIAMHINYRFRGIICSGLLLAVVVLAGLLPSSWVPLTFYGSPTMLEFALGMGLYIVTKKLYDMSLTISAKAKQSLRLLALCGLAGGLGILVLLTATKQTVNILGFGRLLYWGIPAVCVTLLFFFGGLFLPMPKPLVRLGDMSYSIYLVHYLPILLLDRYVLSRTDNPLFIAGISVLGIGIVLVLAYWFYQIVELRGKRIMTSSR